MVKKVIPLVLLLMIYSCLIKAESYDYLVAQDGSGDFTKVQDAIHAIPHLRKNRTVVFIKKGTNNSFNIFITIIIYIFLYKRKIHHFKFIFNNCNIN